MIACIREQGCRIGRQGQRLVVHSRSGEQILFAEDLEQLLLFGNVQLTTQAISLLLERDIETVFLALDGRYKGRQATLVANPNRDCARPMAAWARQWARTLGQKC